MIKNKFRSAFTIVELIVVISVIAILAGIVLVSYGAWRTSTLQNAVKSDLISVASAMESARTFNNAYPLSVPSSFTPSSGVSVLVDSSSTASSYCVDGTSVQDSSIHYYIESIKKDQGPQSGTCATRPVAPGTPAGLAVATTTEGSISLGWTPTSGATNYNLQCALSTAFTSPGTASTSSTAGVVSGRTASTLYYCRMNASNAYGTSAWTSPITATTTALSYPSGLAAGTRTGTSIAVSWSSNADAVNYTVQCGNDSSFNTGVASQTIAKPAVTATFSGLTPNSPYYCRINSVSASNTSAWSPTLTTSTTNEYGSLAVGTSIEGYWTSLPQGFLLEDGSAVSRTTYAALFAVIGTTYGAGNGSTTFNVPDSRGRTSVNISASDSEFNTMGEKYGEKVHTLTIAEMPSHTHIQNAHNHTQNAHNHANPVAVTNGGDAGNYRSIFATNSPFWSMGDWNNPTSATIATNNATTATNQYTGGNAAHNNIQPSIVKTFAIKYQPPAGSDSTLAVATSIEGYWTSAPIGYLLEDGSAVSRTTYADLFAVIGTTYGAGNGSTTFNVPDSRGRVAVNKSTDTEFNTLGEKYGEKVHTLTIAEMPSHTHIQDAHNHTQNAHNHADPVAVNNGGSAGNYRSIFATNAPFWSMGDWNNATSSTTATNNATTATNQYTGGNAAHNNIQPSIVKAFAIKYQPPAGSDYTLAVAASIEGYWTSLPQGFLLEDSSAVSRTTYAALFAVIGTTYGAGNGSTTFNVPDSRGRTSVNISASDSEFNTMGEKYGEKVHTLTIAEMPSHTHIQDAHNHTQNAHNHANPVAVTDGGSAGNYRSIFATNAPFWSMGDWNNPTSATTATNNATTATNQYTGGNAAHNNIQPSIVKTFAIKY